MEKYKHPDDEARLRALFADFVTSGKSVMLSEDGHMPTPFSEYDIQEVGVCASDLITDGLLVVSGEREDAVYVISASHGYNPILVIPTKALVRLKRVNEAKLKEEVSAAEKKTWKRIGEFIATHAWQITCAVIAGLLVLKFQKRLGL
jgi:hypothetical protein